MADRACAVLIGNEKILMVRQSYKGETIWTFPGGGIEPDESPEEAAIREVKEEVGLDIEIVRLLCQVPSSSW